MKKIILMVLLVLFCSPSFAGLEMNPITGKLDKTNDTNVTEIVSEVWEEQGNNVYLIDTSQNVGIGTINPAGKLHVAGPFVVEGDFSGVLLDYGQKIDGDTSRKFTFSDTIGTYNSNLRLDLDTTSGVASFDSSSVVPIEEVEFVDMTVTATAFVGDGSGLTGISGGGSVGWTDGGTNVYATTTSDRVAIGTTTPSAGSKLQVVGTVSATAFVGDGSGLTGIVGGGGLGNVVEDTTPQLGGDLDMNAKNIDFPSTANISDVLDEDNMASNSATKLATQQSIKAYVDTAISGVSGGAGGWTDGGTNVYNTATTDTVGIGTTGASGSLEIVKQGSTIPFMVSATATGDGNYLIVDSGGLVGIGTTKPLVLIESAKSDTATYTATTSSTSAIAVRNLNTTNNNFANVAYTSVNSSAAPFTGVRTMGIFTSHTAGSESADFAVTTNNGGTFREGLRLLSSGNFGISTTNPTALLQVAGDTKIGNGTFSNTSANEDLYVEGNLEVDGTIYGSLSGNASTVTTNANLTGEVTSSGNAATISDSVTVTGWSLGASTATTPSSGDNDTSLATTAYVQTEISGLGGGSSGWTDGTAVIYTTTSTDNVGIGTFNPLQRLQVVGTVQATAFVTNSTVAGSLVLNEDNANGVNTITISAPSSISSNRSCALEDDSTPFDNCVTPASGGWTDGGANVYTTTTTDNVGIGTLSPTANLQVYKSVAGFNGINIRNTNASGYSSIVYGDNSVNSIAEFGFNNSAKDLFFYNASATGGMDFGTNDTSRVFINVDGNVGIGSTAPGSQLTISNGAAHAGQALCVTTAGRVGYCSSAAAIVAAGTCSCTAL